MGRKYASIFVRADAMSGEALRSAWEMANPFEAARDAGSRVFYGKTRPWR